MFALLKTGPSGGTGSIEIITSKGSRTLFSLAPTASEKASIPLCFAPRARHGRRRRRLGVHESKRRQDVLVKAKHPLVSIPGQSVLTVTVKRWQLLSPVPAHAPPTPRSALIESRRTERSSPQRDHWLVAGRQKSRRTAARPKLRRRR